MLLISSLGNLGCGPDDDGCRPGREIWNGRYSEKNELVILFDRHFFFRHI